MLDLSSSTLFVLGAFLALYVAGLMSCAIMHQIPATASGSTSTPAGTTSQIARYLFWFIHLIKSILEARRAEHAMVALRDAMPELLKLQEGITHLDRRNPLYGIVNFFNITSPWHDKGGVSDLQTLFTEERIGDRHEQVRTNLAELQEHILNAGRCEDGINRSNPEQPVTADDVYLGGVWQIWTFPMSKWLNYKDDGTPNLAHPKQLTRMECVHEQAHRYMESHIAGMGRTINRLNMATKLHLYR